MFRGRRVARRTARRTARRVSRRQMLYAQEPTFSEEGYGTSSPTPSGGYFLLAGENGLPPIKLSQSDAARIEEQAGYPPADLEDADLRETMHELNIYSAPLTEQDYSTLGMQPVPLAGGGTTVVQHRTHPHQSLEEQLTSLYSLKEKNLISEDDYNAKKKLVLGI
jgi:hypothetical protein